MGTVRMKFSQVKHLAWRVVICPQCSKPMRRSKMFMQTLNPFNTDSEGRVKTALQIREELVVTGKEWKARASESTELCRACTEAT